MKNTTKQFRIHLSTWNKVKRVIRPRKDETVADYFDRVLEGVINDNSQK